MLRKSNPTPVSLALWVQGAPSKQVSLENLSLWWERMAQAGTPYNLLHPFNPPTLHTWVKELILREKALT